MATTIKFINPDINLQHQGAHKCYVEVPLVEEVDKRIKVETDRAKDAEAQLKLILDNEIARSTAKDNELTLNLIAEEARAKVAEDEIIAQLRAEEQARAEEDQRLNNADAVLDSAINKEVTDRTQNDSAINSRLTGEITRSTDEDVLLSNKLNAEITRSTNEDITLNNSIGAEVERALTAENNITVNLNAEITRSKQKDRELDQRLSAVENLGDFLGSVATYADLDAFTLPPNASTNDFVVVRADETLVGGIGKSSRYILTSLDPIVWTYDITIEEDISGKVDKVPSAIEGHMAIFTPGGQIGEGIDPASLATKENIAAETTARVSADNALNSRVDQEALNRKTADDSLSAEISAESTQREIEDAAIYAKLVDEETQRTQFDAVIDNRTTVLEADNVLNKERLNLLQESDQAQNIALGIAEQDIVALKKQGGHYLGTDVSNITNINVGDWYIYNNESIQRCTANDNGVLTWVTDYAFITIQEINEMIDNKVIEIDYSAMPIETINVDMGNDAIGNVYIEACGNMVQLYFDRFNPNRRNLQVNRWYDTGIRIPQEYRRNTTLEQVTYQRLVNQDNPMPLFDVSVCIHHDTGMVEMAYENVQGLYTETAHIGGSVIWFIGERV